MSRPTVPCKLCGRKIVWGVTAEGKDIPLDPVRARAYEFLDDTGLTLRVDPPLVFVSHFRSCPNVGDLKAGATMKSDAAGIAKLEE